MTRFSSLLKRCLPAWAAAPMRRLRRASQRYRLRRQPPLTEERFGWIAREKLGICSADVVFVHSSVDRLAPNFFFFRLLTLLRQTVGETGTLVFPTYPALPSHEFLASGQVFDLRRTPSSMGLLSELARRNTSAIRSLHPTKSVCAIGPKAVEITGTHHQSPYPYDGCSPYAKVIALGGKAIGLGVSTTNLSLLHCVDDSLKEEFPMDPYHPTLFFGCCKNKDGTESMVPTYAHDLSKIPCDIPKFINRHIPPEICEDLSIDGRPFFRADAHKLYDLMVKFAKMNLTIYQGSCETRRRRAA